MKFGMYALLIISGYVIGLCFAVQGFKFTSNAKYRQNFSFVYMTKIKKLHISLCNKSKCGKCKITQSLGQFSCFCPDIIRKQLEYCTVDFECMCMSMA